MRHFRCFAVFALACSLSFACGNNDNPVKSEKPPDPNQFSFNRTDWHAASWPVTAPSGAVRGNLFWHRSPEAYDVIDVFRFPAIPGEQLFYPFRMIFRPVDAQNPIHQFLSGLGITPPSIPPANAPSWAGVMIAQRITIGPGDDYFSVLVKGADATVHFEFGRFVMDVDGDGKLYTEDEDGNTIVDPEEDIGLDGLDDRDEPGYSSVNNVDPNHDNWFFRGNGKCPLPAARCQFFADQYADDPTHPLYFEWLNGTEGNRLDVAAVGRPDDELLSPIPVLNDAYFVYTPDLSLQPGDPEWRVFGFELREIGAIDTIIGSPTWDDIDYIRVWFEAPAGATNEDTLLIADWGFGRY